MLRVERTRKTGTCPWCGKRTKHLHQYGKERRLWPRFLAGKKLYLVGRKRRWRCSRCQRVSFAAPIKRLINSRLEASLRA